MSPRFRKILEPFNRFIHAESTAGVILLISALAALIIANSPLSSWYHHLWETHLTFELGGKGIDKSLHHWINDGLMALFFFVVGLEMKREIIAGELSNFRKAILPLMAAVGGMVAPALLYVSFNAGSEGISGWGIPMATDIAFALGILALLGRRIPLSLKVFLTALAIADDLGAVLVIAFFYTSEISFMNLAIGLGLLCVLILANYLGVRKTLFYGIIGIGGVWLAFMASGVHATIAGVLAAMTIPARTKIDEIGFIKSLTKAVDDFKDIPPNNVSLLEPAQHKALDKIHALTLEAATPLQRLEHTLHPWVSFGIMPLFAFANSGLTLSADTFSMDALGGITFGVIAGLFIGKFVGVFGMTWLLVRARLAELPADLTWGHIRGVSMLAGVGFTMSLFITNLAFEDPSMIGQSKLGIFTASLLAGVFGYLMLRRQIRK